MCIFAKEFEKMHSLILVVVDVFFTIEADDVAIVGYFDEFSRPDSLLTDNSVHILAVADKHKGNSYKDNDTDDELVLAIDFFHD
jgi:hypothetical protein